MKRSGFKQHGGFKNNRSGFNSANSGGGLNKGNGGLNKNRGNSTNSSRSNQIKRTDRVFSQLVRLIGADAQGRCKCFTCKYVGKWEQGGLQCGHYKSRSHLGLRWNTDNARPQCLRCNITLGGNIQVYKENLGTELVASLDGRAFEVANLTDEDIAELRKNIEQEVLKIRKEKGL